MAFNNFLSDEAFLNPKWSEHLAGLTSRLKERYLICAIAAFLACFIIPILIFVRSSDQAVESNVGIIPGYISIRSQGHFVELSSDREIGPIAGEDYFVLSWFRFSSFPPSTERLIVYSAIDNNNENRPGYSLALVAEEHSFRPIVYWKNENGEGQSVQFGELTLPEGAWCAFGLSFRKNKFLGLHVAIRPAQGSAEVRLLGGYELKGVIPKVASPIRVGAYGENKFRGAIGPFGIFSGQKLSGNLKAIMKAVAEEPNELPSFFNKSAVKLWVANAGNELQEGSTLKRIYPAKRKVNSAE